MNCPRCGVSVLVELSSCRHCGWLLSQPYESDEAAGRVGSVQLVDPPAREPARNGRRPLQQLLWGSLGYRARRRRRFHSQPPREATAELPPQAYWAERPRAIQCLEMPLVQTTIDFSAPDAEEEVAAAHQVAPLARRLQAGLFDAVLIGLSAALFFGLFRLLGGSWGLARHDLLVYGLAVFALTCLYFCLFTYLGGQTPGMHRCGLTPVRFSGEPLRAHDAALRAFGYVVSTGSLLLGFLWAAVDEDQLTWHDRISRTLLTERRP